MHYATPYICYMVLCDITSLYRDAYYLDDGAASSLP